MSLVFCRGDVFAVPDDVVIAHGCNMKGVMGAGVALEVKRRWPLVYDVYRSACRAGAVRPGGALPVREGRFRPIYNLFSQVDPGPCATELLIALSVREMLSDLTVDDTWGDQRTNVVMPLIGSGLGGLGLEEAERAIEAAYESVPWENPVDLYVVSEYVKGLSPIDAWRLSTGVDK